MAKCEPEKGLEELQGYRRNTFGVSMPKKLARNGHKKLSLIGKSVTNNYCEIQKQFGVALPACKLATALFD